MNPTKLRALQITLNQRQRAQSVPWIIFAGVAAVAIVAVYFAWPKAGDERRVFQGAAAAEKAASAGSSVTPAPPPVATVGSTNSPDAAVLTASGYIINRERIEVSPRMMGQVKWIGVKKGDLVTKDQVVVRLDDAEQRARMLEIEGQVLGTKVALERAKIAYARVKRLRATNNETAEREDEARLAVQAAEENVRVALDWTVIRAPIDGVVLEKLAVAGALVTPQSFGGTKGPSTALFAVADPTDLQVEIDVNESDLPKIFPGQKCGVTPEAYADKHYGGYVAEMAPEANRQKGTLQIKVQIENPDRFLTPELSAKVEFLKQ